METNFGPWRGLAYHRVDIDFIWTIAMTSVPDLAQRIRAKFPDLPLGY